MVLVLDQGRIAQAATSDVIYNRPASAAVARFLNCYNLFAGDVVDDHFVSQTGRFPLNASLRKAPQPGYAIRHDHVAIRPFDAAISTEEIRIDGDFIASEYSGAAINSFFALDDGRVFEVESHLSHSRPPAFVEKSRYALVWKKEDALVFG